MIPSAAIVVAHPREGNRHVAQAARLEHPELTFNKIDLDGGDVTDIQLLDGTVVRANVSNNDLRLSYIVDNVRQTDPDIFVVLEVISSRGVCGSLLSSTSNGGRGCLALLAQLRGNSRDSGASCLRSR